MKPVNSRPTRSLNIGSLVDVCDNSGARIVKIVSIKNLHISCFKMYNCNKWNCFLIWLKGRSIL